MQNIWTLNFNICFISKIKGTTEKTGSALVLYTPIIKYIIWNIFSLISTLGRNNGKRIR